MVSVNTYEMMLALKKYDVALQSVVVKMNGSVSLHTEYGSLEDLDFEIRTNYGRKGYELQLNRRDTVVSVKGRGF